jgi:hypothetical protein
MKSNLPPGLKYPLHFYTGKPWLKIGQPIMLFEHLQRTFGNIAQYRFFGTHIVFVNTPEYIHEILINQAPSFVKERTVRRMKVLLGEGLITSDDPITSVSDRSLPRPSIVSESQLTRTRSYPWPSRPAMVGNPDRRSISPPP